MRERSLIVRTTLSMSALIAIIMLILAFMASSYNYGQRFSGLGRTILTLNNEFREPSGAKQYIDYEDMVNIVDSLKHSFAAVMTYNLSGETSERLFSTRSHSYASVISLGVGVGFDKLSGFTIREGRFLKEGDEEREVCVISEHVASRLQVP